MSILPKHLVQDLDYQKFYKWDFWLRPVGNGPYRYLRDLPQTMVELEANPDHYKGRPKIVRVVLKFPGGRFGPIEYFGKDSPIGYHNPRLVALLEQAQATLNPDEIDRIYRETWPIFQADQPMTFLPRGGASTVAHRRVRGLSGPCQADPTGCMGDLWLEDEH